MFNAIAEPQRRAILEALAADERSVNAVVNAVGLAQPSISKHLRVLREVGLVRSRRDGRQILYRTNAHAPGVGHQWSAENPALFSDVVRAWLLGMPLPDVLIPFASAKAG